MGRSRYAGNEVIDGSHYGTWNDPTTADIYGPDILDGIQTVDHIYQAEDRLDLLAFRYFGDEDYWWVIALSNRIQDPWSISAGTRLRIPIDLKSVLDQVQR